MLITHLLWTMRSRSLRDRRVAASHRTGPCQQPPTGPRALPARTDGGVAANLRRIPATGRRTEIAVHSTPAGASPGSNQCSHGLGRRALGAAGRASVEADEEEVGRSCHGAGQLVHLV